MDTVIKVLVYSMPVIGAAFLIVLPFLLFWPRRSPRLVQFESPFSRTGFMMTPGGPATLGLITLEDKTARSLTVHPPELVKQVELYVGDTCVAAYPDASKSGGATDGIVIQTVARRMEGDLGITVRVALDREWAPEFFVVFSTLGPMKPDEEQLVLACRWFLIIKQLIEKKNNSAKVERADLDALLAIAYVNNPMEAFERKYGTVASS